MDRIGLTTYRGDRIVQWSVSGGVSQHALVRIEAAQAKIDAWRWDHNEHHPHWALKGLMSDGNSCRLTFVVDQEARALQGAILSSVS